MVSPAASKQPVGPRSFPTYSPEELQKEKKKFSFLDEAFAKKAVQEPDPLMHTVPNPVPPRKIILPKFFDDLITKKVKEVAIMVIFHIVHFFCNLVWANYRTEFERRDAIHKKKKQEFENLKKPLSPAKTKAPKLKSLTL